ncbi:sensor histidine kinase [Vallitalea okinawensis]|uniref:sensor histidine kinase n=1 Tax=Vallitalea okinawensis TaxID=2078660 RepID=UPI000CFD30F7|nr:sensor histidine kinase [Vallitalea okinawensis]
MIQLLNSRLLSHVITNPLKELTKSAKKIGEGQFDLKVKQDRYDEIGILSKAFNKMTYKIDELIKDVKSEQKKKREYEMALIQEQIKPHFLYNCLDVIYTLCELERVNEASEATKALADYYRVTLSNGKDIITLGEEFKNVEDYLALQAIRYSDVFTYTIHVDEKIKSYRIVKLTLQPLVENAIYHGLKPRGRQGQIWIHGSIVGQEIYIEVRDNGVGMSEDRVQELMGNRNDTNFGLYNVQDRIGLFFGQGYGLEILSQENEGTTVKIRLPMEEIHHD